MVSSIMKLPVILFGLFAMSFSGCRKNIQAGVNIRADGFVIDSVKNKKLSNVTVYLISGHEFGFQNRLL